MKNLIIFVIIIGGVGYYWKHFKGAGDAPIHIENPVYAEVRIGLDIFDRSLEGVLYAETTSEQECRTFATSIISRLVRQPERKDMPRWKLRSTECKEQLPPRHARLFSNEPTVVSYASLSPGNSREREVRVIFWGITRRESEQICPMIDRKHMEWNGPVRCISTSG